MAVEADGIDHEGYQGPCLFRVPTPVGTPRLVGPHGAQENADAEEEDSRVEEQASEKHEWFGLPRNAQSEDACEHGESQQGVAYHYHGDVQAQPGRGENGHEVCDLRIALAEV